MTSPFYPVTREYPPIRVHVTAQVRVGKRVAIVTVARGRKGTAQADIWAEIKGRKTAILPGSVVVDCWRPIKPEAWDEPLPEPIVTSSEGIMWWEMPSMTAVEMAEEMERLREDARNGKGEPERRERQWWRIGSDVRYEPPGSITRHMAEGRIMRALCYDRTIQMDARPYKTNAAVMADLKRGLDVIFGDPTHDWRPPFQSNQRDGDDYLIAMKWLTRVKPSWKHWTCLWARTPDPPLSWTECADKINEMEVILARQEGKKPRRVSRETTRLMFDEIMWAATHEGNRTA